MVVQIHIKMLSKINIIVQLGLAGYYMSARTMSLLQLISEAETIIESNPVNKMKLEILEFFIELKESGVY